MAACRWNDWNIGKLDKHGVTPAEVEQVVNHPGRGFPRRIDKGKWLVWGPTSAGRLLQVIYLLETDHTLFVIHARELDTREKRQIRKRQR